MNALLVQNFLALMKKREADDNLRLMVQRDLDRWGHEHREAVKRERAARAGGPEPLFFLADGDSWFDYPIRGNDPTTYVLGKHYDILENLKNLGRPQPLICKAAHAGDATTDELAWPRRKMMLDALGNPDNWGSSGRPDAILFSGGGNDIVGDHFSIYLNDAKAEKLGSPRFAATRFDLALDGIAAGYRSLIDFRNEYLPGTPIFTHEYDFAVPNGLGVPLCSGPWLGPSFENLGYDLRADLAANWGVVKELLGVFAVKLRDLGRAKDAQPFIVVSTQGTIPASRVDPHMPDESKWANEIHPTPEMFTEVAKRFIETFRTYAAFRGRI